MTPQTEISLALFLTKGNSLASWDRVGLLDRELDYLNRLADCLKHIYIFSYGNDAAYQTRVKPNVTIVNKTGRGLNYLYQFWLPIKYRQLLRHCGIIKTNQLYAAIPALLTKILFPKIKLVIRCGYIASRNARLYHYSWLKRHYTSCLERLAFRLCDLAFIPTEENASYLKNVYPTLKAKLQVLNNAINTDVFRPMTIEQKYDLGYVGRLEKDKNLLCLIEAIKGLNLTVCFIGQGPEKDILFRRADELNIKLTIFDRVENYRLPEYYNSFGMFVFPSLHEGNPKTLLEAMACGLPVIGCNVIGVNSIIKHRENGWLSEPSAEQLRSAINNLCTDPVLTNVFSAASRKYVLDHYALDLILNQETAFYWKLIGIQ